MSFYSEIVLDHYRNPRNVGIIEDADAVGFAENSACGDVLHLYLSVSEGRIANASFKTFGCAAAIAAGSILTEMVSGATIAQISKIVKSDVVEALGGLPAMKVHCSVLAEDAIKAAVIDLEGKGRSGP